MKKEMKFAMVTVVIILCIAFCITAAVKAQDKKMGTIQSGYLVELEKQYRKDLKGILKENGYYNAGITMTKTVEKNTISYEIIIHHKKLNSSKDREDLKLKIEKIFIDIEEAEYEYKFL